MEWASADTTLRSGGGSTALPRSADGFAWASVGATVVIFGGSPVAAAVASSDASPRRSMSNSGRGMLNDVAVYDVSSGAWATSMPLNGSTSPATMLLRPLLPTAAFLAPSMTSAQRSALLTRAFGDFQRRLASLEGEGALSFAHVPSPRRFAAAAGHAGTMLAIIPASDTAQRRAQEIGAQAASRIAEEELAATGGVLVQGHVSAAGGGSGGAAGQIGSVAPPPLHAVTAVVVPEVPGAGCFWVMGGEGERPPASLVTPASSRMASSSRGSPGGFGHGRKATDGKDDDDIIDEDDAEEEGDALTRMVTELPDAIGLKSGFVLHGRDGLEGLFRAAGSPPGLGTGATSRRDGRSGGAAATVAKLATASDGRSYLGSVRPEAVEELKARLKGGVTAGELMSGPVQPYRAAASGTSSAPSCSVVFVSSCTRF